MKRIFYDIRKSSLSFDVSREETCMPSPTPPQSPFLSPSACVSICMHLHLFSRHHHSALSYILSHLITRLYYMHSLSLPPSYPPTYSPSLPYYWPMQISVTDSEARRHVEHVLPILGTASAVRHAGEEKCRIQAHCWTGESWLLIHISPSPLLHSSILYPLPSPLSFRPLLSSPLIFCLNQSYPTLHSSVHPSPHPSTPLHLPPFWLSTHMKGYWLLLSANLLFSLHATSCCVMMRCDHVCCHKIITLTS